MIGGDDFREVGNVVGEFDEGYVGWELDLVGVLVGEDEGFVEMEGECDVWVVGEENVGDCFEVVLMVGGEVDDVGGVVCVDGGEYVGVEGVELGVFFGDGFVEDFEVEVVVFVFEVGGEFFLEGGDGELEFFVGEDGVFLDGGVEVGFGEEVYVEDGVEVVFVGLVEGVDEGGDFGFVECVVGGLLEVFIDGKVDMVEVLLGDLGDVFFGELISGVGVFGVVLRELVVEVDVVFEGEGG